MELRVFCRKKEEEAETGAVDHRQPSVGGAARVTARQDSRVLRHRGRAGLRHAGSYPVSIPSHHSPPVPRAFIFLAQSEAEDPTGKQTQTVCLTPLHTLR